MRYIRRKIEGVPSVNNRLAYIIVKTDDWTEPLEQHPIMLNYSDLYEITDEPIPTDITIWSIEYQIYQP